MSSVSFFIVLCVFGITNIECFSQLPITVKSEVLRRLVKVLKAVHIDQDDTVCCTDGQWEANAFLSSGDVFIDANTFFAYFNGTGKLAYDSENRKSYVSFNVTEITPLMPTPDHASLTVIKDYAKGLVYQIAEDGSCTKDSTPKDMSFVCIPGNAKKTSHGVINTMNVVTYEYTTQEELELLTSASVTQTGHHCEPLSVSYTVINGNPDSGTLYNLDIVDLHPGIKDPSIFIPPKSCK